MYITLAAAGAAGLLLDSAGLAKRCHNRTGCHLHCWHLRTAQTTGAHAALRENCVTHA